MTKKPSKLCISIRTFNRPNYLKASLDSLSCNVDLDEVDFFFIQDGAINEFTNIRYAPDEITKENIQILKKADLPNKTYFIKPYNTGTCIHKELQLNYLFPKYEYAILCDDDLVFNKYYIKTLKVLFEQFKNDFRVGMLQTSFKHDGHNFQNLEEAKKLEDCVQFGFSHRWEQGFWRESAEKIKPFINPYFDLIRNIDFNMFIKNKDSYPEVRKKVMNLYEGAVYGDQALEISTQRAGYLGLHTMTLRHKTLGKIGNYSFGGRRFDDGGYDKIELHQIGDCERYRLI